jgi:hypothetical protein
MFQKKRLVVAILMLISGVTHVSQLFVYQHEGSVIGASIFGVIYFIIGILLLGKTRTALLLGIILPAIGGSLGIYRFFFLHNNPFTIFHVIIDLIVIPTCVYLYLESKKETIKESGNKIED